ncbi:MAG: hypothetical protein JWN44_3843 [Myxococcales bacterium]|nr:hypothetical protein [Myxococcales bacterium]
MTRARALAALSALLLLPASGGRAAADPLDAAWSAATARQSRLVWLTAHDAPACTRALAQLATVTVQATGDAGERLHRLVDARHESAEELRALARLPKMPAEVAQAATRAAQRLDASLTPLAHGRPPAFARARQVYFVTPAPPETRSRDGEDRVVRWRSGAFRELTDDDEVARKATLVWVDVSRFHEDQALPKAAFDAAVKARLAAGPPRAELWTFLDDRLLRAAVDSSSLAAANPAVARLFQDDLAALAARAPKSDAPSLTREAEALARETGKAAELARKSGRAQLAAEFSHWQEHARSFTLRP